MEEHRIVAKAGRISFSKHSPHSYLMNERMGTMGENRAVGPYTETARLPTFCGQLEIAATTDKAMAFLARTWRPHSLDFSQIMSSNNLVPRLDHEVRESGDTKEEPELEEEPKKSRNGDVVTSAADQILTLLSSAKLAQLSQSSHTSWMTTGSQIKAWISKFTSEGRKIRKEEQRLRAAQVHAALSVARLAAAISGIVNSCCLQPAKSKGEEIGNIVASAAALVATVCASAAESAGASREHVASVVRTGLAARSAAEVITLTATTATCLRGVATLELRAATRKDLSEDQKILARGAQLPVRAHEGRIHLRMVCIYLKHQNLALKLGRKHLGGVITTCKEYRIFDANSKDEHGFNLITFSTSGGTIQIMFEDPKLYGIWNTTISHLLYECLLETPNN